MLGSNWNDSILGIVIRKSAILAILRDGFLTSFGQFSGISDHTFGLDGQFQGSAGSDLREGAYYYDSAKNLARRFFANSVRNQAKIAHDASYGAGEQ